MSSEHNSQRRELPNERSRHARQQGGGDGGSAVITPTLLTMPPVGSASYWDGPPPARRTLLGYTSWRGRSVRVLCAAVVLLPLMYLLARIVPDLVSDQILVYYGAAVLTSTIAMFLISFGFYNDPSTYVPALRRRDKIAPPLPAVPRVTLMVAVMNEIDVIDDCVASMAGCDYPNFEVIVVDDKSTDGTAERLVQLQQVYDINLILLDRNGGKKNALVRACEEATGDVLAFTDSDCILAPDALRRCVTALVNDPRLGAVSGHARALNAEESFISTVQDTWYEGSFRVSKAAESVFGVVNCVSGPLAVFRKDAIWNYLPAWASDRFMGAPFKFATDRQLTGYVLGQYWKGAKLKDHHQNSQFVTAVDYPGRKWRVGYVQSAKVWTVVPAKLRPFMKQQIRWKKSFFRNLFFTGGFIWRRGLAAAVLYYGHAAWVGLAPLMATRHLIIAPLQGAWLLTMLYILGVLIKGTFWGLSYAVEYPHSTRWRFRPAMSLISSVVLSWLLPYSILTIRRGTWARGNS